MVVYIIILVVITVGLILTFCIKNSSRNVSSGFKSSQKTKEMSPPVLIRPRFFDEDVKVYYINLAKRKDRNLHIQNELNKSVLLRHYERFEAVDANYVDLEPYRHLNRDLQDKKGEIGGALSHLSLW